MKIRTKFLAWWSNGKRPSTSSQWLCIRGRIAVVGLVALMGAAGWLAQSNCWAASPWQELFNGRDLTGWQGDPRIWSVQAGMIQGSSHGVPLEANTFLVWQGGQVADFELKAEFKIEGGNSGIQYRSQVDDTNPYVVRGYQADIDAQRTYTGILYEESGRGIMTMRGERHFIPASGPPAKVRFADAESLAGAIRPDDWNTYRIRAVGPTVQHFVNDRLMCETEDHDPSAPQTGMLALQVHRGPPMKVQFRKIRLRSLESSERPHDRSQPSAMQATTAESLRLPPGFHCELLHPVDPRQGGSWVSLTVDPRGRLLASDQYGGLFRITPAPPDIDPRATFVEPVPAQLGCAQGMTFVGDTLYVVVNSDGSQRWKSGLYRVRDTDGDDRLDAVELLREIDGEGEHGPHAVIPDPDERSLWVIAGNHTHLPELAASHVPLHWQEDQLVKRLWDAKGHAVGILAPGGWICRTDLDGKHWELMASGFRNAYDMAFDERGELFAYDSDMEWDIGAPWYRPTRVYHVTSGAEFGWRSGSGKWPASFPDCLPPVLEHGPGSPTGVTFGYLAKFPDHYRRALFISDWSFGRIDMVELTPNGASYSAKASEFLTGTPLPVTDLVVNPHDGALYFTIGGRRTQSGLYRVRYVGDVGSAGSSAEGPHSTEPVERDVAVATALRHRLEQFHGRIDKQAIDLAMQHLAHPDRSVRFAARIALEWQPLVEWESRVPTLVDPTATIEASVALARCGKPEDRDRVPGLLRNLMKLDWQTLDISQKLAWLRACELVFIRTEMDDPTLLQQVAEYVGADFPTGIAALDQALGRMLVYCRATSSYDRQLSLMESAPTQEERIAAAYNLRSAVSTMSRPQREHYFRWFGQAGAMRGGDSLRGFLRMIRDDAASNLSESDQAQLSDRLTIDVSNEPTDPVTPTGPIVREYGVDEIVAIAQSGAASDDAAANRRAFAKALCFHCHRVADEGGSTGPDLTMAVQRFDVRYLAESMVEPAKVISDRFQTSTFVLRDGRQITGRVANMNNDVIRVVTNMLNPGDFTTLDRRDIEEIVPSTQSEMPEGLMNYLTEEEIRGLFDFMRQAAGHGDSSAGPAASP